MLADLVKAIDCFGKLHVAVTVALPLGVFELISIHVTALLGDFSAY